MMKFLLKLSLICSLIGLFLIIFLANHLEPQIRNLLDVDERDIESTVKVQGKITQIFDYENLVIFTIEDETGKIDCVFYNKFPFQEQDIIQVTGKIIEYKGKIEIEATKIQLLE